MSAWERWQETESEGHVSALAAAKSCTARLLVWSNNFRTCFYVSDFERES